MCAGIMLPTKMTANHSNLVNVLMTFLFISVLEDESATLCTIPVGHLSEAFLYTFVSSDLLCKIQNSTAVYSDPSYT